MSGVDVLAVMDEAIPGWEVGCEVKYLNDMREARSAVADLIEAATSLLETQDAVDNRDTAGPNAEDYFVLIRRRNAARDDFDDALANVTGGAR